MDSQASSVRRPCFVEEDDGLASIAEFSGAAGHQYNNVNRRHHPIFSRTVVPRRTGSLRSLVSLSTASANCASPRSGRIFDSRFEEANNSPHFLHACFLCKKPLGGNRDIFMYRGDLPFCSEECRHEQIEVDEAREKSRSMKAMRSKQKDSTSAQQNATSSPDKSQKYPFRAGTVAAG